MLTFRALALRHSLRQRSNARNVSTSFLPYGGITYLSIRLIIPIYCVSIPHRRSRSFFRNYSHYTQYGWMSGIRSSSVEGRKRCKKASVDEKYFYPFLRNRKRRFSKTLYGGQNQKTIMTERLERRTRVPQ